MLVSEKRSIYSAIDLSLSEISYFLKSHTRALMTQKIVLNRDAQCNTKESPQGDCSHLHCVPLLRIIHGVISARSCTCALKKWRIASMLSSVS